MASVAQLATSPDMRRRVETIMKNPAVVEERDRASSEDVRRILGDLDRAKVLDILSLRPTVLDLEQASMWLSGDSDIFGPDGPLQSPAGDIVAIDRRRRRAAIEHPVGGAADSHRARIFVYPDPGPQDRRRGRARVRLCRPSAPTDRNGCASQYAPSMETKSQGVSQVFDADQHGVVFSRR
jgi:hypothetical protein